VLGAPFYLMEPIHGIILRRDIPPGLDFSPETARRASESFLDNLALLHSLDYDAIGLGDLGKPQGYLERQARGWIERYEAKTHDIPEIAPISNWIQQHASINRGALIHNDYNTTTSFSIPSISQNYRCPGLGNVHHRRSARGPQVPLFAYWIDASDPPEMLETRWGPTTYPGSLTRAQMVYRYALKTGRDVSNLPFYLVFARFKIAVIVQQIYYRYHQGLTHDERFASMPPLIKLLCAPLCAPLKQGRSDTCIIL
jgi:aminoglycoside phosphotransferase (APT) family kinase protein